jgi:hypothetical protein
LNEAISAILVCEDEEAFSDLAFLLLEIDEMQIKKQPITKRPKHKTAQARNGPKQYDPCTKRPKLKTAHGVNGTMKTSVKSATMRPRSWSKKAFISSLVRPGPTETLEWLFK